MKKYRLLKDLVYIKAWAIYLENIIWESLFNYRSESVLNRYWTYDYLHKKDVENNPEWFEEVKEEPKPKFKIWDYVVYEWKNVEYIKIFLIKQSWENFVYNSTPTADWYSVCYHESHLRKPTQEELEKYFR